MTFLFGLLVLPLLGLLGVLAGGGRVLSRLLLLVLLLLVLLLLVLLLLGVFVLLLLSRLPLLALVRWGDGWGGSVRSSSLLPRGQSCLPQGSLLPRLLVRTDWN